MTKFQGLGSWSLLSSPEGWWCQLLMHNENLISTSTCILNLFLHWILLCDLGIGAVYHWPSRKIWEAHLPISLFFPFLGECFGVLGFCVVYHWCWGGRCQLPHHQFFRIISFSENMITVLHWPTRIRIYKFLDGYRIIQCTCKRKHWASSPF